MMYSVSVGRDKFHFTAAAWARTLFFLPRAKLDLKGKSVDDLSNVFRSTIKTEARYSTRKKTLGGGKKRRELIRNDPRNRHHHQYERTFSPNSRRTVRILRSKRHILDIYVWEVSLSCTVVRAYNRSKNIGFFFQRDR